MGKTMVKQLLAIVLLSAGCLALPASQPAQPGDEVIMVGAKREHNSDTAHIYGQFKQVKCCAKSEKKCDCGKKNVIVEVTKPPKTWEEDDTFVGPFTIRTGDGGDHTYSWRYTEMIKANNSAITDPKISGREVPEEFLEELSDAKQSLQTNLGYLADAEASLQEKGIFDKTANDFQVLFDRVDQTVRELKPFAVRYSKAKSRIEDFLAGKIEGPGDGK